jgi:poly(3-hydroxybutyrate) depolymerase
MASRTIGVGGYHAGERYMVTTPTPHRPGCPLVVVAHGAGGTGHSYTGPARRSLNLLADAGIVSITADLGSTEAPHDGWGNDTAVARIDEVIAWAATEWDCVTDRIGLIGDSAGGATALNWARANPAETAAVATRVGAVDIGSIFQGGAGDPFLVGLINNAYGGNWAAAAATHDPALNTALLAPLADRIRIYYSENDSLIPAAPVVAAAAAIGCRAFNIGAVDHDPFGAMHDRDLAGWMWGHLT